jgi:hypothetical protein
VRRLALEHDIVLGDLELGFTPLKTHAAAAAAGQHHQQQSPRRRSASDDSCSALPNTPEIADAAAGSDTSFAEGSSSRPGALQLPLAGSADAEAAAFFGDDESCLPPEDRVVLLEVCAGLICAAVQHGACCVVCCVWACQPRGLHADPVACLAVLALRMSGTCLSTNCWPQQRRCTRARRATGRRRHPPRRYAWCVLCSRQQQARRKARSNRHTSFV